MRKVLLLVAVMSIVGSIVRAEDLKKDVVFDGDKAGENAKGWADPPEKASVRRRTKKSASSARNGRVPGKGTGWMGCGWNWFGWYPEDAGTDVSHYKNLRFWAKLTGDKKPVLLSATLVANETEKDKKASEACSLFKYCAGLSDGKWHEIVIPISDLYVKKDVNRTKVWEMMLGCWTEDEVNFTLFVDEIAFEGQGEARSQPAPADNPAVPLPKEVNARDPNIRYVGRWDMTNPSRAAGLLDL